MSHEFSQELDELYDIHKKQRKWLGYDSGITILKRSKELGFTLVDANNSRCLIQNKNKQYPLPESFHEFVYILDEEYEIVGLAGKQGSLVYLLIPDVDNENQLILNVARGYHAVFKKNGAFYGRIGAAPAKRISLEPQSDNPILD